MVAELKTGDSFCTRMFWLNNGRRCRTTNKPVYGQSFVMKIVINGWAICKFGVSALTAFAFSELPRSIGATR